VISKLTEQVAAQGQGSELPAPKEHFILMLRWPKGKAPSILDGPWKIPGVKEASAT